MNETHEIPPAVELQLEAANELGWTGRILDPEFNYLFEIDNGERTRTFLGGRSHLNDAVAARLAEDKFYTGLLLDRVGVRVPASARCLAPGYFGKPRLAKRAGLEPGLCFARDRGFPLIVKPNRKSHGVGVCRVGDALALREAVESVWRIDSLALVQEWIEGTDLRVNFLDGEFLAGYRRHPVVIRGNGGSTIRELLEKLDPRFSLPGFWNDVETDPDWIRVVLTAGLSAESVPAKGSALEFGGDVLNLHRWARAVLIREISAPWLDFGRRIGQALGLRHIGIDWRGAEPDDDPESGTVIEANSSPLLVEIFRGGYRAEALAAQVRVLKATFAG